MALLFARRLHLHLRSRGRRAVGLLVLVAGTLPGAPAGAATPSSGSVSDTAFTTTWSAGPFAVPNVSGTAGTVSCGHGQPSRPDGLPLHPGGVCPETGLAPAEPADLRSDRPHRDTA